MTQIRTARIIAAMLKVHLGCGTVYLEGYVNLDGAPDHLAQSCEPHLIEQNLTTRECYYKQGFGTKPGHVVADVLHDLCAPLPFEVGSVEEVVMYQVLEHIPHYDLDKVLTGIAKVLRTGGSLYVSVPDVKASADLLARAKSEVDEDWAIRLIHGTQRNRWSHHFCGYLPRTLRSTLGRYGFGNFVDLQSINFYPAIHLLAVKL